MHWAAKKRLADQWGMLIVSGLLRQGIWVRAVLAKDRERRRVIFTLHNARQYDKDNAYGACKVVLDALRNLGILYDDRPAYLETEVKQSKSTRKEKCTEITIDTEIGPAA
jgi:hypothetical protein